MLPKSFLKTSFLAPVVLAGAAALAQTGPRLNGTVTVDVPDPRGKVTFDCSKLIPATNNKTYALTGAFVSALDYTPADQIDAMRKNGTLVAFEASRNNQSDPKSAATMFIHMWRQHQPPYNYCPRQAQALSGERPGTQDPIVTCPVVPALQQCLKLNGIK